MILLKGPEGERTVPVNTPYRLLPGERVVGLASADSAHIELEQLAHDNEVGLGDMVAKMLDSAGFKEWWDEKHGGECAPCKQRQATLNYIKFQGPKWLAAWIKKGEEK